MNWEGFLMGVSDFGLERLKEERNKKMLKDLEELKETHKIAAERRKEKVLARTVTRTEETADGKLQDFGTFGDPLNDPREQSPWVDEQRTMARDAHTDALETSASQRDYNAGRLALQGQELAERRASREGNMGPGTGASTGQAVIDLVGDYKDLVDSYVSNDTFTMEEIYTMGNAALRSAATNGADVADTFRRTLTTVAGRRAGGVEGYEKRTPAAIKRQLRTGSGG